MSAIAGYWGLAPRHPPRAQCEKMLAALAEYGRDAADIAEMGDLAFGRRLWRLLPEDAHDRQPLLFADRFALVADLRLDNRDEIGAALGLDRERLRILADSELLLLALVRWDIAALDRLCGDFAFAFFDREKDRLILARDPLGQRPLFWHRGRGFVAFASMPKGLHATGEIARRANLASLAEHLLLLPHEGGSTYFEGLERVEPGHYTAISPGGARAVRYWSPRREDLKLRGRDEHVEAFRALLDQAVAARLRGADGLAAAHLSGGWDSSAVTATAARLLAPGGGRLVAFTSVPRPGGSRAAPRNRFADESALAAATACRYDNVEHVLVEHSGASPLAGLDRDLALFERPLFNLCNQVWLEQIRAAARDRGATVLLTGELGNWTISTAPHTRLNGLLDEGRYVDWAREAGALLRGREARLRAVASASFAPWLPRAVQRMIRRATAPDWPRPIHPNAVAAFERRLRDRRSGPNVFPKSHFEKTVAVLRHADYGQYRKGVLAGWGIDKRDPTADRRLIDFCASLPLDMLIADGARRPLARASLSDRLPAEVLDQTGKGYQSADWGEALTADLDRVHRLIDRIAADPVAAALIDVEHLRRLVREWPQDEWESMRTIQLYRSGLLDALAVGHFVLRIGAPEG